MRTPLGDHLESERLAAGLTPGQLALRAGWADASRGGARIRELELGGPATPETLRRVAMALGVPQAVLAQLQRLTEERQRQAWERWAEQPVELRVSVRLLPGFMAGVALPQGVQAPDAVLAWVTAEARRTGCLHCIQWSRRRCTYVRGDGSAYQVEASFESPEAGMSMRVG